jgi:hypothetical protein
MVNLLPPPRVHRLSDKDQTMTRFAINTALAALLGLGSVSFAPVAAMAQGVDIEIGRDGPRLRLREECDPRREDCGDSRRDEFRRDGRRNNFCTEDRALMKAERMGIRRARIDGSNRRFIDVRGRDRRGDRVEITFGRAPNCPVVG